MVLVYGMLDSLPSLAADAGAPRTRVLRIAFDPARPSWLWQLPQALKVLQAGARSQASLMQAFAAQGERTPRFSPQADLTAVALGPVLDAPDTVEVTSVTEGEHRWSIRIVYTRVRETGAELRQNLPWRPAVCFDLPGPLPPAAYQVQALWHVRGAPTAGHPEGRQTAAFRIE
jgi:hypothetical protein